MALRNLLLVTYQFPPIGGSGVQRMVKLARYLPRAGWRAHVLSAGHTHYPLLDPLLAHDIGEEVAVHRVCGLEPAAVATTICRHLKQNGNASDWLSGLEDRIYWRLDRMCSRLQLPEAEMLWMPAAVRRARQLVDRYRIEAVVTTSPPHSTHLVGLALKRRLGLPWIADLRDPILDNFAYQPKTRLTDRFWRWLERSALHHADHTVVTCPELVDRLMERYPDLDDGRFSTITNGFDPADRPAPPDTRDLSLNHCGAAVSAMENPCGAAVSAVETRARRPCHRDRDEGLEIGCNTLAARNRRFTLSYVGAFYRQQTISPILEGIRSLRASRSDIAADLEFRLNGSLSASQRRLLREEDAAFFRDVGYRSHEEAIAEMARADVLLLATPAGEGGRLCIPAKTFEYLAFGGHVIALVHKGSALAGILAEAGNVTLLSEREPGALARAVERCHDARRAGSLDEPRNQNVVERFRRDLLAARFAEVVERCADGVPLLRVAGDEAAAEEVAA